VVFSAQEFDALMAQHKFDVVEAVTVEPAKEKTSLLTFNKSGGTLAV
jgi:hypothetical protein